MKWHQYFLSLLILISISGCSGVQYTDSIQAIDIGQIDKKEITTRVIAAAEEWRNSGTILKKGVPYKITATGR